MARPPVVIYGAGGHGRVIADIVEWQARNAIAGFVDDQQDLWGKMIFGCRRVLGGFEVLANGYQRGCEVIIAVGDNVMRRQLSCRISKLGYRFAIAIHPSCQIGRGVEIGLGTVVMANAVINTGTNIGAHVIINTGATVDHDCIIEDFVHIAPGAHLGGGVFVGQGSLVGIGASVIERIQVGKHTVIGAGAAVTRDIPHAVTAVGIPARVVKRKHRREGLLAVLRSA